jgi:hypothetical protein
MEARSRGPSVEIMERPHGDQDPVNPATNAARTSAISI